MKQSPVFRWRGSDAFAEAPVEVGGIRNSDRLGDTADREFCFADHFGGESDAVLVQIDRWGKPEMLLKNGVEIGFRHANGFGKLRHAELFGIVLRQIGGDGAFKFILRLSDRFSASYQQAHDVIETAGGFEIIPRREIPIHNLA